MWADYKDGKIVLSWDGGESGTFAVRQGSRVPQARQATPVIVSGTAFEQEVVPEPNGVVFYVVE